MESISLIIESQACHPDEVWLLIVTNRQAKLGQEFADWYEESEMQKPQRLDIPDLRASI